MESNVVTTAREKEWQAAGASRRYRKRKRSSSSSTQTGASESSAREGEPCGRAGAAHMGNLELLATHKKTRKRMIKKSKEAEMHNEHEGKDLLLTIAAKERDEQLQISQKKDNENMTRIKRWKESQENPKENDAQEFGTPPRTARPMTVRTKYMRTWEKMDEDLQAALLEAGYTKSPLDGDRLSRIMEIDAMRDRLYEKVAEFLEGLSQKQREKTWNQWEQEITMLNQAAKVHDIMNLDQGQLEECEMIKSEELKQDKQVVVVKKAMRKWRHYSTAKLRTATVALQHRLEKELKTKWAYNLVSRLTPYEKEIPNMARLMHRPDKTQEYIWLLGRVRWRTIKQWVQYLKQIQKSVKGFIPWDEEKIHNWMEAVRSATGKQAVTPAKFANQWTAINKLSSIFGLLQPGTRQTLQNKKDGIMEELVQVLTKRDFRAVVPNLEMIELAEEQAVKHPILTRRYCMAIWCHMLYASARFNDEQHACHENLVDEPKSVEVPAWQTKTSHIMNRKQKPQVLIAPKTTLSGHEWWHVILEVNKVFRKDKTFRKIDFMVPAVTKDKSGFIPRPMTNAQFLSTIRSVMYENTTEETKWSITTKDSNMQTIKAWDAIKRTTASAPRVFAPEFANKAGIPQQERAYLGRWSEETMADVYTRDQRRAVLAIWQKFKVEKHLMRSYEVKEDVIKAVPTELQDDHYTGATEKEEKCTPMKQPVDDWEENENENGAEDQTTLIWTGKTVEDITSMKVLPSLVNHRGKLPADLLPERLGGPLRYAIRRETRDNKVRKIHLVDQNQRSKCGLKTNNYDAPTAVEIESAILGAGNEFESCDRCFRFYTWGHDQTRAPNKGAKPQKKTQSSESEDDSDSSDSESSNDTESENEALKVSDELLEEGQKSGSSKNMNQPDGSESEEDKGLE